MRERAREKRVALAYRGSLVIDTEIYKNDLTRTPKRSPVLCTSAPGTLNHYNIDCTDTRGKLEG